MPEMETPHFAPLKDVAFGIGDKFDYDGFKIWASGQQWSFKMGISVGGDIVSGNWNGPTPLDLSSKAVASAGFALDSSEGSAQFEGSLWVDGSMHVGASLTVAGAVSLQSTLTFSTNGLFRTAPSGSRIQMSTAAQDQLALYGSSGNPGFIYGSGTAATGDGTHRTLSFQSPAEDSNDWVRLTLWSGADGGSVDGGSPRIVIDGGAGLVDDIQFRIMRGTQALPSLVFDDDGDTGMYGGGNNRVHFSCTSTAELFFGNNEFFAPAIGDATTGSAANVFVEASGSHQVFRSTSSLRYKPGWQHADLEDLASLELPTPIVWIEERESRTLAPDGVTDIVTDRQDLHLGFGTEHVAAMLPAAVADWDGDGLPENYDVRALVAVLVAKVKRLEKRLA